MSVFADQVMSEDGEWDVPAREAMLTPGWRSGQVEVVGLLSREQLRRVADYVFDQLDTALRAEG
jgi:hypothetical protein